ncbi:GNAT family N-acetyltransferase [Fusibacter bizertensis]
MPIIEYRKLHEDEIEKELFEGFNRYQEVNKCWRKEHDQWVLKEIVFTESWDADAFEFLVKCLKNTVKTGGVVYVAFEVMDNFPKESDHADETENEGHFVEGTLIGFVSVENVPFGSHNEYLQLSSLHTSYEKRGQGIGRRLLALASASAQEMGAKKLYISAHSSEETQTFYKSIGCVEAAQYNQKLVDEEPYDCQLEYCL